MLFNTVAFHFLLSSAAFALPRSITKRADIAISDFKQCTPGASFLPCASSDFICCMGAADVQIGKFTCRPAQIDNPDGCVKRGFEAGYEEERQKAIAAALRDSSSSTSSTCTTSSTSTTSTTTSIFIDSIPNGYYAAPVDKKSKASAADGDYEAPSQPTPAYSVVEAAHSISKDGPSPALSAAPALSGLKAQSTGQEGGEVVEAAAAASVGSLGSEKPVSITTSSSIASQPSGYAAPGDGSSSSTTSSSNIAYAAAATPAPLPACSYPYTGAECNSSHTPALTKSALVELCKQCAARVQSMDVENKLKDCLGKVEGGDRNSLLAFETFGVREC